MKKTNFINLYIGYDKNEALAYHVLVQSIIENTSIPVRITPIVKEQNPEFNRVRSDLESTDFSITRFLTPSLSQYEGWSLFVDCDFIFPSDLAKLWDLRDDKFAVMVCKHNYKPKNSVKFLDKIQTNYDRKNWSSLILFNNSKCSVLTTDFVNTADGVELHQFNWLENDDLIGELPLSWNYLCEEENQTLPPDGIHYTNGGPWFQATRNTQFSIDWIDTRNRALLADPYSDNTLIIDGEEYEIIPPRFKAKGLKSDYFQLMKNSNESMYHLKVKSNEHRGIQHKYPYIYMQALGAEFAKYFKISTQEHRIVRLNGEDFLLTKDIRGTNYVDGMEPLSYYSDKVIPKTRDLNLLKNEMDRYTKQNCADFFTSMILFDTLIANVQRDARSLRIFEIKEQIYVNEENQKIKTNHEFLIENNYGNFLFSKNKENNLYTQDVIIKFIEEYKTFDVAMKFFNALNPENLIGIIEKAHYLSDSEKDECCSLFRKQFEYLMPVENFVLKYLGHSI